MNAYCFVISLFINVVDSEGCYHDCHEYVSAQTINLPFFTLFELTFSNYFVEYRTFGGQYLRR